MIDELLYKLSTALNEPIEKECQVVFILSKIRKLIERSGWEENFPILDFYIDWALHSEIDRTKRISQLLREIEETILGEHYDPGVALKLMDFQQFREQIRKFLEKCQLMNQFDQNDYWRKFRNILVDTLKDCPLRPKVGEITKLNFVKSTESNVVCVIEFKNHTPLNLDFEFINH